MSPHNDPLLPCVDLFLPCRYFDISPHDLSSHPRDARAPRLETMDRRSDPMSFGETRVALRAASQYRRTMTLARPFVPGFAHAHSGFACARQRLFMLAIPCADSDSVRFRPEKHHILGVIVRD